MQSLINLKMEGIFQKRGKKSSYLSFLSNEVEEKNQPHFELPSSVGSSFWGAGRAVGLRRLGV